MFSKTLKKLTIVNSVVFLAVFLTFGGFLYGFVARQLFNDVDDVMQQKVQNYPKLESSDLDPHIYIFLRLVSGEIIQADSLNLKGMESIIPYLAEERALGIYNKRVNNHTYRILCMPYEGFNESAQEILAVTLVDSETALLRRLFWLMMTALILGILTSLGAAYFLARRALVPIQAAWNKQQQFVADASHELRTPLSVINNNAELLLRHPDRTIEEECSRIVNITRESLRMKNLVTTLLTLARADAAEIELKLETWLIHEVIDEIISQFKPLAEQKRMTLNVFVPHHLEVIADRERLFQLLVILLDNAMQYTPEGGEIGLYCKVESSHLLIQVRDTGSGISPENLPHIFDRFYRGDKVRSRETGGAGLGLAIAKWIVEKHGGKIEVDSRLGQGTKFQIYLPLHNK